LESMRHAAHLKVAQSHREDQGQSSSSRPAWTELVFWQKSELPQVQVPNAKLVATSSGRSLFFCSSSLVLNTPDSIEYRHLAGDHHASFETKPLLHRPHLMRCMLTSNLAVDQRFANGTRRFIRVL
jgi:hypothetical protein